MKDQALKERIAALEAELLKYAAKYGMTDQARHLLSMPQE